MDPASVDNVSHVVVGVAIGPVVAENGTLGRGVYWDIMRLFLRNILRKYVSYRSVRNILA